MSVATTPLSKMKVLFFFLRNLKGQGVEIPSDIHEKMSVM